MSRYFGDGGENRRPRRLAKVLEAGQVGAQSRRRRGEGRERGAVWGPEGAQLPGTFAFCSSSEAHATSPRRREWGVRGGGKTSPIITKNSVPSLLPEPSRSTPGLAGAGTQRVARLTFAPKS